jgi:Fur family zinc uptake transcriptional regulator
MVASLNPQPTGTMATAQPHDHDNAHDHESCVETAMERAIQMCEERGVRLTELRRQVLELVWARHEPIGAYDILDAMRAKSQRKAAPPTVYRALDFLMEQGLVHRIASLNAYIGCPRPERRHAGQFLICTCCGALSELDDPVIANAVIARAAAQGFAIDRQTIEAQGLCARCRVAS